MRNLITLLLAISCAAYGHDIQGVFLRDGAASDIPRTTFPFDAFKKVQSGRVYTLWIAPDGAFVFYIEKPWDSVKYSADIPDQRFRLWIVEAKRELALPEGFEDLDSEKKGSVSGVEELVGTITIDWRSETDYTIELGAKGAKGHFAFRGYLLGGARNSPVQKNSEPNKRPDGTSAKAPPSNPSQGAAVPHP